MAATARDEEKKNQDDSSQLLDPVALFIQALFSFLLSSSHWSVCKQLSGTSNCPQFFFPLCQHNSVKWVSVETIWMTNRKQIVFFSSTLSPLDLSLSSAYFPPLPRSPFTIAPPSPLIIQSCAAKRDLRPLSFGWRFQLSHNSAGKAINFCCCLFSFFPSSFTLFLSSADGGEEGQKKSEWGGISLRRNVSTESDYRFSDDFFFFYETFLLFLHWAQLISDSQCYLQLANQCSPDNAGRLLYKTFNLTVLTVIFFSLGSGHN